MPTNLLHHSPQNRIKKVVKTWQPLRDLHCTRKTVGPKGKKHVLAVMLMRNASHISGDNICRPWQNSPMAGRIFGSKPEPIFGSKSGPQNGVQNWITFSFLLVGLCLGPDLGSGFGPKNRVRFGPKNAVSHRRILPRPGKGFSADLRCTPREHDS